MPGVASISILNGGRIVRTYEHAHIVSKGEHNVQFISQDGDEFDIQSDYIIKKDKESLTETVTGMVTATTKQGMETAIDLAFQPVRLLLGMFTSKKPQ